MHTQSDEESTSFVENEKEVDLEPSKFLRPLKLLFSKYSVGVPSVWGFNNKSGIRGFLE